MALLLMLRLTSFWMSFVCEGIYTYIRERGRREEKEEKERHYPKEDWTQETEQQMCVYVCVRAYQGIYSSTFFKEINSDGFLCLRWLLAWPFYWSMSPKPFFARESVCFQSICEYVYIFKYYRLNLFKEIAFGFSHNFQAFLNLLQAFLTVSLFKLIYSAVVLAFRLPLVGWLVGWLVDFIAYQPL